MDVGDVQVVEHGLPLFLVSFFANVHKGLHEVQVLALLQTASLLFRRELFFMLSDVYLCLNSPTHAQRWRETGRASETVSVSSAGH